MSENYEPYGKDWEKEVMKMQKKDIIKILKDVCLECNELRIRSTGVIMKQDHNMKKGDTREFSNFGELEVFAKTYNHEAADFKFNYPNDNKIIITKL